MKKIMALVVSISFLQAGETPQGQPKNNPLLMDQHPIYSMHREEQGLSEIDGAKELMTMAFAGYIFATPLIENKIPLTFMDDQDKLIARDFEYRDNGRETVLFPGRSLPDFLLYQKLLYSEKIMLHVPHIRALSELRHSINNTTKRYREIKKQFDADQKQKDTSDLQKDVPSIEDFKREGDKILKTLSSDYLHIATRPLIKKGLPLVFKDSNGNDLKNIDLVDDYLDYLWKENLSLGNIFDTVIKMGKTFLDVPRYELLHAQEPKKALFPRKEPKLRFAEDSQIARFPIDPEEYEKMYGRSVTEKPIMASIELLSDAPESERLPKFAPLPTKKNDGKVKAVEQSRNEEEEEEEETFQSMPLRDGNDAIILLKAAIESLKMVYQQIIFTDENNVPLDKIYSPEEFVIFLKAKKLSPLAFSKTIKINVTRFEKQLRDFVEQKLIPALKHFIRTQDQATQLSYADQKAFEKEGLHVLKTFPLKDFLSYLDSNSFKPGSMRDIMRIAFEHNSTAIASRQKDIF